MTMGEKPNYGKSIQWKAFKSLPPLKGEKKKKKKKKREKGDAVKRRPGKGDLAWERRQSLFLSF